ncbi:MAG: 50S ribosomal protein L14 [candidate division WS1 bacterium]|nr:50S ribosomal protein L14 [candidate division WS1 bacterium]
MIQTETRLKVTDNSGVQEIGCIRVRGVGRRRWGSLGDEVVASAKQVTPSSPIPKGTVLRAVIVRCRPPVQRADGSQIRFDDNAAVIVDNQGNPQCTRVFGPVARELREKQYLKIISLAPEVI